MHRYTLHLNTSVLVLSCLLVTGCTGSDGTAPQVATHVAPIAQPASPPGSPGALTALIWHTNLAEAQKLSAESQRPMFLLFTGSDWCFACKLLKKQVFDTEEFALWAKQNVILMDVDFPAKTPQPDDIAQQNDKLLKLYGIEGNPTVVIVSSPGKELGRTEGYAADSGPKEFIALIDKIIAESK